MKYQQQFESIVRGAMEAYHAPGLAVTVIDRSGKTLYDGFFGCRDEESGKPVTEDTIFGMASVTKSFTCLAVLQLCEKGVLDLDAPVSKYLPRLKDDRILVRHLMEHSAGFFPLKRICIPEIAGQMGIFGPQKELTYDRALAERGQELVIDRFNSIEEKDRLGKPGEYMSYCNDGYGLLSELIRLYGGENSYAEYIKKNIFMPLGMDRSTCEFVSPFQDENCTSLYLDVGGVHTKRNDFYDNAFVLNGGGAIRATLRDMKQYLHMLMNGGEGLVSPWVFEELTKPGPATDQSAHYCKGVKKEIIDGTLLFYHNGGLTGISNRLMWAPEEGIGVLAFCNKSSFPINTVAHAALDCFGLGREPHAPQAGAGARADALGENKAAVLGVYRSGEGANWRIYEDENGMLMADSKGRPYGPVQVLPDGALAISKPYDTVWMGPMALSGGRRALRTGARILLKTEE